ncbi:beclin 1-associated autophagy-related key regulator-like [Daphnia pulex]|uniref:beclin 1-associated autophagy-related key regulator-like n=1 Tax=Daphnia pulex TaxID=6669 RepID=UPI001EDD1E70|nr:beclin 1-associated autophagy-related key regulator-like [Daphnia pulex]
MSDDSAPSVFPLSNSSEDELLDKNEIADKCPLCRSAKKYFFCSDCIRNGDFYSSRSVQRESSQRFVEKKMALLKVKGEIQELLSLSQTALAKKNRIEAMQHNLRKTKERIQLLKKWKEQVQKSLESSQPILNELRARKLDTQKMISLNCAAQELPQNPTSSLTRIRQELEVDKTLLKEIIQENVKLLLKTIFPITCEGLNVTGEEDSESLATVKNELDDASHVTYVRGQWIYADTGHNGRYKIAGADLPGTGDMTAYLLCVEQVNKGGNEEKLRHFKVALSHVTQLCNLLAFYFGVRLPKKVAHSDFISSDLDAKIFAGRIARLHANVLYLCTSQGVAPIHLRHANPLARLSTLLDPNICDLGRSGPFEFHPELWGFEEAGDEEGCLISFSSSDGEDDINADWESVGHLSTAEITDDGNKQRTSPIPPISARGVDNPVTNSVVSVVSGVASFWKAFPWSK